MSLMVYRKSLYLTFLSSNPHSLVILSALLLLISSNTLFSLYLCYSTYESHISLSF